MGALKTSFEIVFCRRYSAFLLEEKVQETNFEILTQIDLLTLTLTWSGGGCSGAPKSCLVMHIIEKRMRERERESQHEIKLIAPKHLIFLSCSFLSHFSIVPFCHVKAY